MFVLTHYAREPIEMQGGTTFDEITLDIVPVLLGAGERLFDGVQDPGLEPTDVIHSRWATHVRYRVRATP